MIIHPPSNAIQPFTEQYIQEAIVAVLKATSTEQAAIVSSYAFNVLYNKYMPLMTDVEEGPLVNVLLESINPNDKSDITGESNDVVFNIDCYVLGQNQSSEYDPRAFVPADEVACQKLQYLCSQVKYSLTALNTYWYNLNPGSFRSTAPPDLKFNSVVDADKSDKPYAPARFTMKYETTYDYAPITGAPDISAILLNAGVFSSQITY